MFFFIVKVLMILFFFICVRGTLPRYRIDQFLYLNWKIVIYVLFVYLMLVIILINV